MWKSKILIKNARGSDFPNVHWKIKFGCFDQKLKKKKMLQPKNMFRKCESWLVVGGACSNRFSMKAWGELWADLAIRLVWSCCVLTVSSKTNYAWSNGGVVRKSKILVKNAWGLDFPNVHWKIIFGYFHQKWYHCQGRPMWRENATTSIIVAQVVDAILVYTPLVKIRTPRTLPAPRLTPRFLRFFWKMRSRDPAGFVS